MGVLLHFSVWELMIFMTCSPDVLASFIFFLTCLSLPEEVDVVVDLHSLIEDETDIL
jgi:hypothetical protein